MTMDAIPTEGNHRGVELHAGQSPERLAVVRKDIDLVFEMAGTRELIAIAGDPSYAPEARLFAAAKLTALHSIAVERREVRPPGIDLDYVKAIVAGVNSNKWRDPDHYCSLLCYSAWGAPGAKKPAKRDVPLR
jgi:hypothetical protein